MAENQFQVITKDLESNKHIHFEGTRNEVAAWLRGKDTDPNQTFEVYCPETLVYYSVSEILALTPGTANKGTWNPEWEKSFGLADVRPFVPPVIATMVPKYFVMNPETDDLLPDGLHLRDGMKVLIENPGIRFEVVGWERGEKMDHLLKWNRWCTVSHVATYPNSNGDYIHFVGTYDDGTKRRLAALHSEAWYVKKDSIPDPVVDEEAEDKLYEKINFLLKDLIADASHVTKKDNPVKFLTELVTKATIEIMDTFKEPK
jgi:hypothetical protein